MRPLAAIDIGSNTVHLLVGTPDAHGEVKHHLSESVLLELGREVEKHGKIREKKLRRLRKVLRHQVWRARKLGARQVLVAATGAVRRAENGEEVRREIERSSGVEVKILTAPAEARLAFLGSAPALHPKELQVLIDSGGASTEVTLTRGRRIVTSTSMGIGASLLCADLEHDPPGPLEWARLSLRIAEGLRRLPPGPRPQRGLAVGGAAHRLEELNGKGPGAPVELDDLERIAGRLLRHSSKRIARASGVPRKKVMLLAAGALIIHAIMCHYGLEAVDVGHQGLRDGMITAYRRVSGNWWRPEDS